MEARHVAIVAVAAVVMAAVEGEAITEVEEAAEASMEAVAAEVLAAGTAAEVVEEDLIAAAEEVEVHTVEAAAIRIAKLCESPW